MLTRPRTRRNAAETEVPMIPPVELNWSNLLLIAPAVAATTMLVMMTILFRRRPDEHEFVLDRGDQGRKEGDERRMAQGEEHAYGYRVLASCNEPPGHEVNCL